jgi:hypothetical protein
MNPDDIANQQQLLAQHRRTLAIYLHQLANLGANYAPPAVHNGIREARAAIQRIKVWLRDQGEDVDDIPGDEPTPEEAVQAARPAREVSQSIEGDHNIQAVDSTFTVHHSGDKVGGDKVGGDKVGGDKVGGDKITIGTQYVYNYITQVLQPTRPSYRAAVVRMVEDYTAVFGGRDAQLAALDTFLAGDHPYALLIAPTGRGKTALLIHWLAQIQAAGDWHVIFAPISLRYQTASADATLGALAALLADLHGEREKLQEYRQTPEDLRALVADYLRRPLPGDRRLLLVLDGLDEAVGWQIGRDLFPHTPGPHLRVVASARQLANTARADWLEQLGWRSAQAADLDLPTLERAAVSDVLRRMGNLLDALATDVDLLAEIARVSQGDPLTIRLLVEALQDGSLTPGNLTHLPPGLEPFVRAWLKELEAQSAQQAAVRVLLGLCATALGPLAIADLETLAPELFLVRAALNQAARSVARFIIGDGSEESGYVFSHPRLRELFLENVLSLHERADLQQRFIAYGERWHQEYLDRLTRQSGVPTSTDANHSSLVTRHSSLPSYLRQFWIAHLALAERWDLARAVLTDIIAAAEHYAQPWAAARYTSEGSYAGYLADLDRLWSYAEKRGDLVLGLRCALIAASIRSLSGNLSPELLVSLVTIGMPEGKWSATAALEHVRQMPDAERQAKAIRALLDSGCSMSFPHILEVASTIVNEWRRAEALGSLAAHLPAGLLAEALAIARAISREDSRAWALGRLAAHLSPHDQPTVLAEALTAVRAISREDSRAWALGRLAAHLPAELLAEALAAARAISREDSRALALGFLAAHLSPHDRPTVIAEALTATRAITDEWSYASALDVLVSHLLPEQLAEVFNTARAMADEWSRARTLSLLAPHLPPELLTEVLTAAYAIANEDSRASTLGFLAPHLPAELLAEALHNAHGITQEWSRAETLSLLAPHLPPELFAEALTAARAFVHVNNRAEALSALARHLPPHDQSTVVAEALTAVRAITDEDSRASTLGFLASHLPAELLAEALIAARAIVSMNSRAKTLSVLASHLPAHDQAVVVAEAMAASRIIADEWNQARALGALVSHLPLHDQILVVTEAVATTRIVPDELTRARALGVLAPHLPPVLLTEALTAARSITDERNRASALGVLAPHLPPVLLTEALTAARSITDKRNYVSALSVLVRYLPLHDQPVVIAEAVAVAHGIIDKVGLAWAFIDLAPHLSPELLDIALDTARAITDENHRASALSALAPHLSLNLRVETLVSATAITDEYSRAEALGALAPHLPPKLLAEALDTARAITDEQNRASALSALAPHLPAELLASALESAHAITDEDSRAEALGALALHLSPKLFTEILNSARSITLERRRAETLSSLAPHLAIHHSNDTHWHPTIRILAARGRPALLRDLAALTPWLAALASPEDLKEIAIAIRDVAHCWP